LGASIVGLLWLPVFFLFQPTNATQGLSS